jgi:galactose-1-phosphate uridylyltransferase
MARDLWTILPDGTEKYVNPFDDKQVWYIPGRRNRPIKRRESVPSDAAILVEPENYCDFCPACYMSTPPEKARLIAVDHGYEYQHYVPPEKIFSQHAEFRRVANLFQILTLEYWRTNYSFQLPQSAMERKQDYLSNEIGYRHIISVIDLKLKYSGYSPEKIHSISVDEKIKMSDAFFAGSHELVIPRRHYVENARISGQHASSGELSQQEHFQYMQFTIQGVQEIMNNNRFVRYVSVYQNWLRDAGASFDHLHKQLVALDRWGDYLQRLYEKTAASPHLYNEYAVNFACENNLVIAENDYAIALIDIGQPYPTVAIYSKSTHCHPWDHTKEEIKGFSDLVHAIHMALGADRPCNEEWYYMPVDGTIPIPWHVLIKWRANVLAGLEGGTLFYIVPLSLMEFRDILVPRLYDLCSRRHITGFQIAEDCTMKPNSLGYDHEKVV